MFTSKVYGQDYNCGTYGVGTYSTFEGDEDCETDVNLEDTGQTILPGIILGSMLITAGIATLVNNYRRRGPKK